MKYAFVCDTPYQLLSAISIVLDKKCCKNAVIKDLYIDIKRCRNVDMRGLSKNIKRKGLFDNVYELNSLSSFSFDIFNIANKIEWMFPRLSIQFGLKNRETFYNKDYDVIFVSGPFMLQRNFIYCFPRAHVYFLEDGSGSYNGRIGVDLLSKTGNWMQKVTKRGPAYIIPERFYLYFPQFYEGEYKNTVFKQNFPPLEIAKEIFPVNSQDYRPFKGIYFGQSVSVDRNTKIMDRQIIKIMDRYFHSNIIVRPHPQETNKYYGSLKTDKKLMQWEIICGECINNNSVLIGKFSTAQMTPKLIYDKEPIVVFTYKLYGIKNENIVNVVKRLKNFYRDKSRIICVNDTNEFEKCLKKYLQKPDE